MTGNRWIVFLVSLISGIVLVSCGRLTYDQAEYVKYVTSEENGLIVKQDAGSYEFSLQYRPTDFEMLAQMQDLNDTFTIEERRRDIDQFQYFTLKIGSKDKKSDALKNGVTSNEEYQRRMSYLMSDNIKENIRLVEGKDTLQCLFHHFERSYSITPFNTLILVFKNNNPSSIENKTLILDDEVFGVGRMKFTIDKEDIKEVQTLKLAL